jgi:hypothetical protein
VFDNVDAGGDGQIGTSTARDTGSILKCPSRTPFLTLLQSQLPLLVLLPTSGVLKPVPVLPVLPVLPVRVPPVPP